MTCENLSLHSSDDGMSKDVRVAYLYMDEVTRERFNLASDRIGWANKNLVQQCVAAFFKKHREYYINAAKLDYAARNMAETEYYTELRDGSIEGLSHYRGKRPDFGTAPLDSVPDIPTLKENKQTYGVVRFSDYNSVLFKVALIVDRGAMIQVLSRIVKQHFDSYWDLNYGAQIALDDARRFEIDGPSDD